MHKPMNAPLARYSISIGFPAATLVARVRMMPMAIAAIAHIGSNLTWRCSIITLMLRSSGNRLDLAIDVPTIHYANKLLTETTFAALLYVLFLLALHRPNVIALGLLTGVLVLVRPIAIFFFVPLAIVLAIWHKSARYLATFTLLALLLPVGWAARNKVQTGVFSVSSIGNINLLSQRAAGALAIEDEGDFRQALTDEESALTDEADDWIQQTLHIPDAEELPVAVRAKYYAQ